MSKEIGIDALLIFFLISSEFGGNKTWILALARIGSWVTPRGSWIGNRYYCRHYNLVKCSLLATADQTQVTRASHDRRASTTRCVRAIKIIIVMIKMLSLSRVK